MANSVIVSVTVGPKKKPVESPTVDILGDWFNLDGGWPEPISVSSIPYWHSFISTDSGYWKIDYQSGNSQCSTSLGDIGFPGFAYDDRPCKWVRTEAEVADRLAALEAWHLEQDYYG